MSSIGYSTSSAQNDLQQLLGGSSEAAMDRINDSAPVVFSKAAAVVGELGKSQISTVDLDAAGAQRMRVAYVLPASIDPASSIGQKIERTLKVWVGLGVEHRLFVLGAHQGSWSRGWDAIADVTPLGHPGLHNEARRQLAARVLAGRVLQWGPDLVYSRIFLLALALDRLHRRLPLVHEVNSDDVIEFPRYASRLGRLHPRTRHLTLRRVDGFVFVTDELRRNVGFQRYDVPSIVIGNGIDTHSVPRHPAPSNDRPRLLFLVGSSSAWTGIDKFAALASALPEFDFDLAGDVDGHVAMPSNVTRHGYLVGDDLEALLRRADVGLGTLALHRKSMDEACTLKVRECLSRGIPMILPYRDTDVDPSSDGVLTVANTEDNVSRGVDDIRAFVNAQRGRRVPDKVVERLDSAAKERCRLEFLEHLVEER